jgi:MYXO-CTERM domain-containing protein
MMRRLGVVCALVCALAGWSADAQAFCGTYVSGGDAELFNNATQVTLLRVGTKTVLSMQNDYEGPVKDFAMVVPVPEVLAEGDVKTLPADLFAKVDALGAPRLVAYAQQDPCDDLRFPNLLSDPVAASNDGNNAGGGIDEGWGGSVRVEAEFAVGEYEIVILSADEAAGLMAWLDGNGYDVSSEAEEVLQGYITQGMYFFVAKVDPAEVTFDDDGEAVLSPLRFDYDSEEFALPVRLGMLNSTGEQDLIVNIISDGDRYEVANAENVTIPTNLEVADSVREDFGGFYRALFDRTLEEHPGAVVTEYAWQASKCDPCPPNAVGGGALDPGDVASLGGDVVGTEPGVVPGFNWTLTRLHARYAKGELSEDLVFAKAAPIMGGTAAGGPGIDQVIKGSSPSNSINQFQGRYILREYWTEAAGCVNPDWDRWGPSTGQASAVGPMNGGAAEASGELDTMVREHVPAIGVLTANPLPEPGSYAGCGCAAPGSGGAPAGGLALFALGVFGARRRRRVRQGE